MTPQEVIEDRMLTLYGARNIARLSRESGVPRESISKILSYKRGVGQDVAEKLSGPLKLPPEVLLPPAAEVVSLATLDARLRSLEGEVAVAVSLMRQALELLAQPQADGGRRARGSGSR